MSVMRILALSSSRVGNSGYLEKAAPVIKNFLGEGRFRVGFVPFAAVADDHAVYLEAVREGLSGLPITISLVSGVQAVSVIENSNVIMVGGGNTFKLLHDLYEMRLLDAIREKARSGTPYIGWSAGANIAGATIRTTNDMPVIEPHSFRSLGLLPFQINPHYHNIRIEGQNGETRDDRLTEFIQMNPSEIVIALPEGSALVYRDGVVTLTGEAGGFLFRTGETGVVKTAFAAGADLSFLLNN